MIDFARLLSFWLFDLHQPEQDFWHNMSPRRFVALADARTKARERVSKSDTQQQPSLYAYLTGGGG